MIHEMIALVHMGASTKKTPKTIDQTPSDEVAGYLDGSPDDCGGISLGEIVGHWVGEKRKRSEPAEIKEEGW